MSVSAVSRSVSRLEGEVGHVLFDRDRRSIRPTGAAEQLRVTAEGLLRDWNSLKQSVQPGSQLIGELRLYCSVTATYRLLSPVLEAFRSTFPGVRVLLQTGDQADGVDRVRQGDADAAVIACPEVLPRPLVFRSITESALRLCLSESGVKSYGFDKGRERDSTLSMLANVPWILPERGVSRQLIDAWLARQFNQPVDVYARVAGHEAIAAMVSLGLGVGIIPQLVVDASGFADSLEVLDLADSIAALNVGICVRSGRVQDPVVDGLLSVLGGRHHRDVAR